MGTSFDLIYTRFLDQVTDDMFVAWDKEQTYMELEGMLMNSIPQFRFAKINLNDHTKSEVSDASLGTEFTVGHFEEELSYDEIYILSLYMVGEWMGRQANTVRLTELQYTGSDAKALNTSSQLRTLMLMREENDKKIAKQVMYYQSYTLDKPKGRMRPGLEFLAGKNK